MTETYLHFIWKLKRLPLHQLITTDNKVVQILSNGIHNFSESGPDFFNARMLFDNMEWAGQIEMHIKSSDWYRHKHQHDEAYNNVILHVVYEYDKPVFVNGVELPTVELKSFIEEQHYLQWERFAYAMNDIPCENSLHTIDKIFLNAMIERAITDRLNRKINELLYIYDNLDNQSVLYHLLAKAFGTKINSGPFELLVNQLPLSLIKRLNRSIQKRLIFQTSGLFGDTESPEINSLAIQKIPASMWKRKGLRPSSFPENRLHQFTEFIFICDFDLLAEYLSPKDAYAYIVKLSEQLNEQSYGISKSLLNQLFVNAFIPFYWLKSLRDENEELQGFVLDFLQELKPEDNHILRKWKNTGVVAINAYESQALIELYNEYCSRKKCMSCQVFTNIFK